MSEIAINLKGQDNLSQTVKNATKSVEELKYKTTELGKASKEFDRITNSGKPLKAQLAQLKKLLAEMNFNGLGGTAEFTKMAQAAGQMQDAIADASDAVKRFSSDTMNLDASIQAIQGIAAAASIATGAMALLGQENEDVEKAILKVQAALSILNGVQAIANTLNKDSALMQKIKQIRLAATARTTMVDTAATTANTVATTANTVATVANTTAQKAWNVAKAIGKAMFGDFTGLLLLGVAAMATYAIATGDATDAENERNATLDEAKKKQQERSEAEEKMASSIANSAASQIAAYLKLQQKWKECNGDVKKQEQFMSDYKTEINNTGFAVNSLSEAEDFFVGKTDAVVAAIMARAEAQANYELMVDRIKKGLQDMNEKSVRSGHYYTTVAWGNLTDDEKEYLKKHKMINYNEDEDNRITQAGIESITAQRNRAAIGRQKTWRSTVETKMWDDVNVYLDGMKKANEKAKEIMGANNLHSATPQTTTPHSSKTTHSNTNKNDEPKAKKGSLEAMEQEVQQLQKALKWDLIDDDKIETAKNRIKQLQKEIKNKEIELGFKEPEALDDSLNGLKNKVQKLQNQLHDGLIPQSDIEKTKQEIKDLNKQIEKLEDGFKDKPLEGTIDYINDKISEINKKLTSEQLDINARIELITKKDELQREVDKLTNGEVTIKADVEPTFIAKGSIADMRKSYDNAADSIKQLQTDLERGIITEEEFKSKAEAINEQLRQMNLMPIEIEFKTNIDKVIEKINSGLTVFSSINGVITTLDAMAQKMNDNANAWEQFVSIVQVAEAVLQAYTTIQTIINALSTQAAANKIREAAATQAAATAETEKAATDTASVATTTAATVALKAQEAAYMDTAAAALFAAHAAIPFAGVGIASGMVAAMMAAMTAQHAASAALAAFKEGGIVGGSMYEHPILAHKGEMVLSEHQQQKLFDILDSGGSVNNMGNVQFVLKGSDLYGSFSNYTKIKSKVGKI